jgi:hypothetical protein
MDGVKNALQPKQAHRLMGVIAMEEKPQQRKAESH